MAETRGKTTEDPFLSQQKNSVNKGRESVWNDTAAMVRVSSTQKDTRPGTANKCKFQLHT